MFVFKLYIYFKLELTCYETHFKVYSSVTSVFPELCIHHHYLKNVAITANRSTLPLALTPYSPAAPVAFFCTFCVKRITQYYHRLQLASFT